jgi:hypothetical protein
MHVMLIPYRRTGGLFALLTLATVTIAAMVTVAVAATLAVAIGAALRERRSAVHTPPFPQICRVCPARFPERRIGGRERSATETVV